MRALILGFGCVLWFATVAVAEPKDAKKKLPGAGTIQWRILNWQQKVDLWKWVDVEVTEGEVAFVLYQELAVSTPITNLNLKRKGIDEFSFRDSRGTVLEKGFLEYDFGKASGVGAGSKIRARIKLPAGDVWKKTKIVVVGAAK